MEELKSIDHVEQGVDRLSYKLSQDNVIKLLTIFLEKTQEIEEEFITLANQKSIDLAEGVWLDYLGNLVGVDREGASDVNYRQAIRFKIGVNIANGTPNTVISMVKEYTESTTTTLAESALAFATLSMNGRVNLGYSTWDLLDKLRPTGTRWLLHSDIHSTCFMMAYEDNSFTSEAFQTTDDGVNYENFEVTPDSVNFETFFTISTNQSYYAKSLFEGRNSFYYEGVEDENIDTINKLPLHWEIFDDSEDLDPTYDELIFASNDLYYYANYILPLNLT